jgi:hypothetical protein
MTWPVLHLTQSVDAAPVAVVAVASDPEQLPRWAAGLSAGIRNESGRWISDSPLGVVEVAFVGPAEWGVLDHDVTPPDGAVVRNVLRVLPNDEGSEVVFSLFHRPDQTDAQFDDDARHVREDLLRLKALVERIFVE